MNEQLRIVQYGSVYCPPCAVISHRIEAWRMTHQSVLYEYVSVDEDPASAAQNNIFSLPAVVVYAEGKEVLRRQGTFSLTRVLDETERIISLMNKEEESC